MLPFGSVVVCEEGKPAFVAAFEQDGPRPRLPGGVHGCEDHRVWLEHLLRDGFGEPPLELHDRIQRQVLAVQAALGVILAKGGELRRIERHGPEILPRSRRNGKHFPRAPG
jgi:hypothetical protein